MRGQLCGRNVHSRLRITLVGILAFILKTCLILHTSAVSSLVLSNSATDTDRGIVRVNGTPMKQIKQMKPETCLF